MIKLTEKEALKATILFLQQYYEETKSDDTKNIVKALLNGQRNKVPNQLFNEWRECLNNIKTVLAKSKNNSITEQEAFEAMFSFLEGYYKKTNSDDIGSLLGDLLHGDYGSTSDPAAWYIWQECLHKVKKENNS